MPFVLTSRYSTLLLTALFTCLADQVSKWCIMEYVPRVACITIIQDFLHIVHIRNRGAAFGFLNSPHIDWQIWLFALATFIAVLFIRHLMRTAPISGHLFPFALGMVLGGAFGNMIDRIRFHSVIDFIDVQLGTWHWPAFNIADSGICIGAGITCILMWRLPSTR